MLCLSECVVLTWVSSQNTCHFLMIVFLVFTMIEYSKTVKIMWLTLLLTQCYTVLVIFWVTSNKSYDIFSQEKVL